MVAKGNNWYLAPDFFPQMVEVRMELQRLQSLRSGLMLYWSILEREPEEGVDGHCPCGLGTVRTLAIYDLIWSS